MQLTPTYILVPFSLGARGALQPEPPQSHTDRHGVVLAAKHMLARCIGVMVIEQPADGDAEPHLILSFARSPEPAWDLPWDPVHLGDI